MRIAIDLTATPKSKTGIGRYMMGLLSGLQSVDNSNEYFLYTQSDDLDGFNINSSNFHIIPVNSKILRRTYIRIIWEQVVFPFRLRKNKIDILHCPNYTMPYLGKVINKGLKVVATFHDMTYFVTPEYLIGWKAWLFRRYIKKTAKRADRIITISKNSKEDIPRYCRASKDVIDVTYMGADESFFFNLKSDTDSEVLRKYGVNKQFILYVGTLEPRKNIPGLIRGYSLLDIDIREKYDLVIIGKKGWYYDEIFKLANKSEAIRESIKFLGFVEDDEMKVILRNASVLSYISFYEGFGIPVIEGMASRVPVLTSRSSSLTEIAEGYCFLCDPNSDESIADKLSEAIKFSNELLEGEGNAINAIENTYNYAKRFTWETCADETIKTYKLASSD